MRRGGGASAGLLCLAPLLIGGVGSAWWASSGAPVPTTRQGSLEGLAVIPATLRVELEVGTYRHVEFGVLNGGKAEVILASPTSSCGCTNLTLEETRIPPGGRTRLTGIVRAGEPGPSIVDVFVREEGTTNIARSRIEVLTGDGLAFAQRSLIMPRFRSGTAPLEFSVPVQLSPTSLSRIADGVEPRISVVGGIGTSLELHRDEGGDGPWVVHGAIEPEIGIYGAWEGELDLAIGDESTATRLLGEVVPVAGWPSSRRALRPGDRWSVELPGVDVYPSDVDPGGAPWIWAPSPRGGEFTYLGGDGHDRLELPVRATVDLETSLGTVRLRPLLLPTDRR